MCFVSFCFVLEEYHKKAAVNHLRENLQYMLKGRFVANKAVTEQVRLSFFWGSTSSEEHSGMGIISRSSSLFPGQESQVKFLCAEVF